MKPVNAVEAKPMNQRKPLACIEIKLRNVDDAVFFNNYLTALEIASDISISTFNDYLAALKSRHDFFAKNNCSVSDHGLEEIYAEDYTINEVISIFFCFLLSVR